MLPLLLLGATSTVHLSRAGRTVPVAISADIAGEGVTAAKHGIEWKPDGAGLAGTLAGGGWTLTLKLQPGDGAGASLDATLHYDVASEVDHESIGLRLPGGSPRAVDWTLAWSRLTAPLRVDRGTPVIGATDELAVVGGAGFIAARYEPEKQHLQTELFLDDAGAHPFSVYEKCWNKLPPVAFGETITPTSGAIAMATPSPSPLPSPLVVGTSGKLTFHDLEKKKPMSRLHRAAGDEVTAHATLYVLDPTDRFVPLIPERWPDGAQAAVVFTDHADRTDPPALRAILYGTSDVASPDYGKKGFFGHDLKITKSFFTRAAHGGLESDPDAAKLADEIVAHGSEVASHSPTMGPDARAVVKAALPVFAHWHAVTWIDHEPYTNCEALSTEGWENDAKYGIHDLLVEGGFRWVWAASDVSGFHDWRVENVFRPEKPDLADPAYYPLPVDPRLWVFESSWFYGPAAKIGGALNADGFDALQRERGLFVGHTYLSASARTTRSAELKNRLAVHEGKKGELVIDPAIEEGLTRLATRVHAGSIASMTWSEAGARLRAIEGVTITYLPGGDARIENHGVDPIDGLTIARPKAGEFEVLGGAGKGQLSEPDGRTLVWLDLPVGGSALIEARLHGVQQPIVDGAEGTAVSP